VDGPGETSEDKIDQAEEGRSKIQEKLLALQHKEKSMILGLILR
jgi:hypothetical protein